MHDLDLFVGVPSYGDDGRLRGLGGRDLTHREGGRLAHAGGPRAGLLLADHGVDLPALRGGSEGRDATGEEKYTLRKVITALMVITIQTLRKKTNKEQN